MIVVRGIDADLAVIHGTGIQRVNADPGISVISRPVDSAIFVAVGTLEVLSIGCLSAQSSRELVA